MAVYGHLIYYGLTHFVIVNFVKRSMVSNHARSKMDVDITKYHQIIALFNNGCITTDMMMSTVMKFCTKLHKTKHDCGVYLGSMVRVSGVLKFDRMK